MNHSQVEGSLLAPMLEGRKFLGAAKGRETTLGYYGNRTSMGTGLSPKAVGFRLPDLAPPSIEAPPWTPAPRSGRPKIGRKSGPNEFTIGSVGFVVLAMSTTWKWEMLVGMWKAMR
jgi:hypothetical protein